MDCNFFKKIGWTFPLLGFLVFGASLAHAASVTLAWNPTADPSVVGYRVYEGVVSQSYTDVIDTGDATTVTVSNLVAGTTYYFAVTSYTADGLESPFSGEITYTPGLPVQPQLRLAFNSSRQAVLSGTAPAGYKYDVQSTSDLRSWTALANITAGADGLFEFTDLSTASNRKFYRLRQTAP